MESSMEQCTGDVAGLEDNLLSILLAHSLHGYWCVKNKSVFHGCLHICPVQAPEMVRVPLEELVLQIQLLKLGPTAAFLEQVIEPPPPRSIQAAVAQLQAVGALSAEEQLTPLGAHCPPQSHSSLRALSFLWWLRLPHSNASVDLRCVQPGS